MTGFRRIEGLSARPPKAPEPGPAPRLDWVAVASLVVEESYQRAIAERGVRNIRQIAENFRWARFAPIVVAPREDGLLAVIDGQHRAVAAATIGIERLPAMIVEMSVRERAEAFTYINSATTALTPMAKFHAAVAALDPMALAAQRCLDAAGARVSKYVVGAAQMKPGETLAAGTVLRAAQQFGEAPLTLALRVLVAQGKGGALASALILGITRALAARPARLADAEGALARLARLDALALLREAERARVGTNSRVDALVCERIGALLDERAEADRTAVARPDAAVSPAPGTARPSAPSFDKTPRDSETPARSAPQARVASAAAGAAKPSGAPAPQVENARSAPVLDDELAHALFVNAGLAFGASRHDVALAKGDAGRRARDAVVGWLVAKSVASDAIAERFPGVDVGLAAGRASEARKILTGAFMKFDAMMAARAPARKGAA